MGGSRLSVCKLSALGQSYQSSVTLDRCSTFIVQTELGIKTQTPAGRRACAGYNSIQKRCRWTALFLSFSADRSSNPMSSFALLCSGITLCAQATEMD